MNNKHASNACIDDQHVHTVCISVTTQFPFTLTFDLQYILS